MRRALTAAAAVLLVPVLGAPAGAAAERMQLDCGSDIGVIERTNGSSWWGVDSDAGYVTEHLLITEGDEVVHEKDYGRKGNGERFVCVADHFDTTWTVHLVRTR